MVKFSDIEKLSDDTLIYHSAGSLWWTHEYSDLMQSSQDAIRFNIAWIKDRLKEDIDQELRTRFFRILKNLKKSQKTNKPVDPEGNMLQQIKKKDFVAIVKNALKKEDRFGKHGIYALMYAHHQNCEGVVYRSWDLINEKISNQK